MKYKVITFLAVFGIVTVGIVAMLYRPPVEERFHQHLHINKNELSDTAHGDDIFHTHLPLVSMQLSTMPTITPTIIDNKVNHNSEFVRGAIEIFDEKGMFHHLEDTPTDESKLEIKIHGNSSKLFDKKSYRIKLIKNNGDENKEIEFLGMPKHDEWILHGPVLDKTLIRNYISYNLAGEFMENTPEVRFFELFINEEYQGVYLAVESIERSEDRVPIKKGKKDDLFTSYILRTDRYNPNKEQINDFITYTLRRNERTASEVIYPNELLMTPEKLEIIEDEMSKFEKAIYSLDLKNKKEGYRKYIDVNSFIDYFVFNEFTKNTDAGLFSTYCYKDVRGKLVAGPIWDFNNAYDNYMDSSKKINGFDMVEYPIYLMLTKDEEFIERIISRYNHLRKNGSLNERYILKYIDDTVLWLGDAIERNNEKWGYTFDTALMDDDNKLFPESRNPKDFNEAIDDLKTFVIDRGRWLDQYIENLKQFSHFSKVKKYTR